MSDIEKADANDAPGVSLVAGAGVKENIHAIGTYHVECLGPDGKVKWTDTADNLVTIVGKNLALDVYLATSSYAVVGPFMGLISSTSYSAVATADTMASHGGWLEAGLANAPTYTAPRKTAAWSAAASGTKSLSSALSFGVTGSGTVKGAFLVYGTGAVSTIDSTAGVLYSAGLFTGGDRAVASADTLNVSYTASL
jgi:hypothetical protein